MDEFGHAESRAFIFVRFSYAIGSFVRIGRKKERFQAGIQHERFSGGFSSILHLPTAVCEDLRF